MSDLVNHPAHYQHPSGVEAIVICEHEGFCVGNAIKYLMRAGKKEGANELDDLRKAAWYINHEIKRREKQGSVEVAPRPSVTVQHGGSGYATATDLREPKDRPATERPSSARLYARLRILVEEMMRGAGPGSKAERWAGEIASAMQDDLLT